MRVILVVICLLLTLALLSGNASAKRRPRPRPRPRRSIWSSIRRNAAEIKKLSTKIKETEQFEQEFGPVIDTLKENVDDMKEGFAAQTMLMAQMRTSMNDMKDSIRNLQNITSEGGIYTFFSGPARKTKVLFKSLNTVHLLNCQTLAWTAKKKK